MNLLNKSVFEKSTEKINSKIIDTMIWTNKREKRFLSQVLKNQAVFERINDKKVKGVIKTKTFTKIYLKEYVNTRFNKEKDKIPLINPSMVNIFKEDVSTEIFVLILVIKEEKHMLSWNKSSPILRIDREILDIKLINCSIIKKEEFMQIA